MPHEPIGGVAEAGGSARVLRFADLFEGLGTSKLNYSDVARDLSGSMVAIEGFLSKAHGPVPSWLLVEERGVCPDCAPVPVAAIALPGLRVFVPLAESRVRITGRLQFGFHIEDETASMLRVEGATCVGIEA